MHDGRFKQLKDVLAHYGQLHEKETYYSKELKKLRSGLNSNEQKDLIAFLKTLSDQAFLFNPAFKYPKDERNTHHPKK
jgi:cytochrome c peroxidase